MAAQAVAAHHEFFSTIAQVIPVILLIVAFELRQDRNVFEPSEQEGKSFGESAFYCSVYLALFGAEAAALHVLASDAGSAAWRWGVGSATTFGGVAALFLLVQRDGAGLRKGTTDFLVKGPLQAFVSVVVVAVLILGVFFLIRYL